MHAGLYDDSPRSLEIIWIMIAQRAARGLGSLYAHANTMTMEAAGGIHSEMTPRGWMKTEKELLLLRDFREARGVRIWRWEKEAEKMLGGLTQ